MTKRKNIKRSYTTSVLGIFILSAFILSAGYFIYGISKTITDDKFSLNSNQVWCANCQTYHDKATAEQEAQETKLVWCINCNRYHAPDADENK